MRELSAGATRMMLVAVMAACVWGQDSRVVPLKLDLVDCRPVASTPYFRLQFRVTGGAAAGLDAKPAVTVNGTMEDVIDYRLDGDVLQVTVPSPYPDLATLMGRTLDFDVTAHLANGTVLRPDQLVRWTSGDLASVYTSVCQVSERHPVMETPNPVAVWRPVFTFLCLAGLWTLAAVLMAKRGGDTNETITPLRRNPGNTYKG